MQAVLITKFYKWKKYECHEYRIDGQYGESGRYQQAVKIFKGDKNQETRASSENMVWLCLLGLDGGIF